MAGSPIFSVNFTNRKNSAVLNYHKSRSWSNQPVLWDFYLMFLLVSSLYMFVTSLRSKRFQSSYCAKVRAEAIKKKVEGGNAETLATQASSLLFSIQSMAWQATFDVITSWPFLRPPWKTGGKSLYALVPFWSWNTLQHYLVDVMMKQKSFFVQGNLNLALM